MRNGCEGQRVNTLVLSPAEKDFFLDEFHDRTFLFALHAADLATESDVQNIVEVCTTLVTNETRVLLLIGVDDNQRDRHAVMVDRLSKLLVLKTTLTCTSPVDLSQEMSEDLRLARIWSVLRTAPFFVGLWSLKMSSS